MGKDAAGARSREQGNRALDQYGISSISVVRRFNLGSYGNAAVSRRRYSGIGEGSRRNAGRRFDAWLTSRGGIATDPHLSRTCRPLAPAPPAGILRAMRVSPGRAKTSQPALSSPSEKPPSAFWLPRQSASAPRHSFSARQARLSSPQPAPAPGETPSTVSAALRRCASAPRHSWSASVAAAFHRNWRPERLTSVRRVAVAARQSCRRSLPAAADTRLMPPRETPSPGGTYHPNYLFVASFPDYKPAEQLCRPVFCMFHSDTCDSMQRYL